MLKITTTGNGYFRSLIEERVVCVLKLIKMVW